MTVSRRGFVESLALGSLGIFGAPLITPQGRQAHASPRTRLLEHELDALEGAVNGAIRLNTNENPNGPSPNAIRAMQAMFPNAGRYPSPLDPELRAAIAAYHGVSADNVLIGCGSAENLKMATYAFTSPNAPLVTASPTYGDPATHAAALGHPVRAVRVDSGLGLDLNGMAAQARGAGLVFLCNPNNPTGTVHGWSDVETFIETVLRASPTTKVLVDEAYDEFVEEPSYRSAIPLAVTNPNVFVVRTFSKIHGMAGLRLGYAIGMAETLAEMRRFRLGNGLNSLVAVAAIESLKDSAYLKQQKELNREGRNYLTSQLAAAGFPTHLSHANFIIVEIGRDVRGFIDACRERNVLVGRPFPPLDTHARISIGTMDELRTATPVILEVLRST